MHNGSNDLFDDVWDKFCSELSCVLIIENNPMSQSKQAGNELKLND